MYRDDNSELEVVAIENMEGERAGDHSSADVDARSASPEGCTGITEEELNKIEARANAATKPPWRWGDWSTNFGSREPALMTERNTLECLPSMLQFSGGIRQPEDDSIIVLETTADYDAPSFEDRMFIACARDDIPALVAEVRRLRAALVGIQEMAAEDIREGRVFVCHSFIHQIEADARAAIAKAVPSPTASHREEGRR